MSCTICGYGFPIADGDAVTLDFEKAKEFLKKHVGSFGQTDEEMQILDALKHAESDDAEEDELKMSCMTLKIHLKTKKLVILALALSWL